MERRLSPPPRHRRPAAAPRRLLAALATGRLLAALTPGRLVAALATVAAAAAAPAEGQDLAAAPNAPSFEDVLSLDRATSVAIAPDGGAVAYTVVSADWKENRYDTEIWLAPAAGDPFQLTRTPDGSSTSPAWSPDGRWIAFLAERGDGDDAKGQVHLIRPDGGEAWAATEVEEGVQDFAWSPDGSRIALRIREPESDTAKAVAEQYGGFEVEDAEWRNSHLWVVAISKKGEADDPKRLTDGDFHVDDFAWSPDGNRIALVRQPTSRLLSFMDSDLFVLEVGTGELRPLVEGPGPDGSPAWSPDGKWVLFSESVGDLGSLFYRNGELARVRAGGGEVEVLTAGFDEDPCCASWTEAGIRFAAGDRTRRKLYVLDPGSGTVAELAMPTPVVGDYDASRDGRILAVIGEGPGSLEEVWRVDARPDAGAGIRAGRVGAPGGGARPGRGEPVEGGRGGPEAVRLTDMTAQIEGWPIGTREVLVWESEDGTPIEGVLYKPEAYDPSRPRPLLVQIHGGPTATSRPEAVPGYVYPILHWLAKGALVLQPNYRGSAGYGEAFRSLNVRNLGVGDMWDVMSGVEHLVGAGVAHPDSLGAMGWSQGGYISAFLATNTDAFEAISVGAGISDWMTYYVSTDIHPFTRQYLKGTPWDDPEVYARTSPITNVARASTPTLIQHGEFDRRVPIPNAYQLYQGLQDQGVETRLVVYEGFGHGITKPKERLAAVWHNWQWFAEHVWGEEVDLPVEVDGDGEPAEAPVAGVPEGR